MTSNHPDRASRFMIPEGMKKFEFTRDVRITNAGTFVMRLEDHTMGNLLKQQLHRDPTVLFVAYKIPHPLDVPLRVMVKIQTDGSCSPKDALQRALGDLTSEIDKLKQNFNEECNKFREETQDA